MPTLEDRISELPPHLHDAIEAVLAHLIDVDQALSADAADLPGLGPAPSRTAAIDATARNEARVWEDRRRLYEASWSRTQAAERLGVSLNQITNLVSVGDLLALEGPDGLRLPAWQFDAQTRRVRIGGIRRVAAVFPGGVLWLSSWMTGPDPSLGGRTPRQALLDGDVDLVEAVAAQLGG